MHIVPQNIMQNSVRRIAALFLALLLAAPSHANLFNKPEVNFWYPPFAAQQPQWKDGKLVIDLKQAAGKDFAVLELALPDGMIENADYLFSFKAAAQPDGALVVLVPDPHPSGEKENEKFKARSDWGMHGAGATQRLIEFVYRPNLVSSGDKIMLFWDKNQIEQKTVWTLSDFTLVKAN